MFTDSVICSYIYSKLWESQFGANLRRPTYWIEAICEDCIKMASVNGKRIAICIHFCCNIDTWYFFHTDAFYSSNNCTKLV